MPKANKATKESGRAFLSARIPVPVKEKLERKADRERRSVSAVVELILTQATANEP